MYRVDARFAEAGTGKGVGRWRFYHEGETLSEAAWAARDLIPGCKVRVRRGRDVVVAECFARDLGQIVLEAREGSE